MRRRLDDKPNSGGGGSGKVFKVMEEYGGPALLAGSGAAGYADYKLTKQKEQDKNEAASEMKRESRGIPKPANFDAMQESIQDAKDAKDRAKIKSMGYAKGGSASSRADGCVTKGKTKGRFV